MSAAAAVDLRALSDLVGLAHIPGHFDCAHLAVLVQRRVFGREVAAVVPDRHPVTPRRQAAAVLRWRAELAEPVEFPETGDVILFLEPDEGHGEQWHIGTLFIECGERWVLHTHGVIGESVFERLADCRQRGLRVEGFYRWRAACSA